MGHTDSMIGKLLDSRYRVISLLGSGGFSQTYIAEDTRRPSCPQCVVKHLQPFSQAPEFLQEIRTRFYAEADALEKLGTHDQIPQLLACFEDHQEFYLVQEFIAGHSLDEELVQPQPETKVVALLADVLEVLKFVHAEKVIHRDIKPNNLIRRQRDGKIVLIDFGAVKAIQTQIANPHPTIRIGTPGYTPPEQDAGHPCFSSDLYALGVTAIQALTGVHPNGLIDADGWIAWQDKVQVSRGLAALLERMTCHRAERYQSAQECLEKLATLTGTRLSLATVAAPLSEQIAKIQTGQFSVSQFSVRMIGGAALAIGLTFIGVVLVYVRGQTAQAALTEVKRLQATRKYQDCLEQTNRLLQGLSIEFSVRHQAYELLNQCQIGIDEQQVQRARQLAAQGKLVEAITAASQITSSSQLQPAAQHSIAIWTQRLLQLGWNQYHQGELTKAIAYAQSIPPATNQYQTAQTTVAQWQKSWQGAEAQFQTAQRALNQGQWQQAIDLSQQSPESEFWQQKLAGIESRAKTAQQAEATRRSQRIAQTLERLNQDQDQVVSNVLKKAYPHKNYEATEAISELRVRRNNDHVTFRFTVVARGWLWTQETITFDWEVLMLQQQHVQAAVANRKPLNKYQAEELNNYFLALAEEYL